MNSDQVGMVACWYGPTKGDEYSPGHSVSGNADDLLIRMVYAQDATTFQQISYRGDTQVWTTEQSFSNLNGAATPACYNEAPGTVDYMMFVDMDDSVNVYWCVRRLYAKPCGALTVCTGRTAIAVSRTQQRIQSRHGRIVSSQTSPSTVMTGTWRT